MGDSDHPWMSDSERWQTSRGGHMVKAVESDYPGGPGAVRNKKLDKEAGVLQTFYRHGFHLDRLPI